MKVEVLGGLDAVDARAGTRSRARVPAAVFLTWQWQNAWAAAFARRPSPPDPHRVTDDDGALAAVLPLYENAPGGWCIVGGEDVSDYLDMPPRRRREAAVWEALLQHRAGERSVWELHAVPGRLADPRACRSWPPPAGLAASARARSAAPCWRCRDPGTTISRALRQGPPRAPAQDAKLEARAARPCACARHRGRRRGALRRFPRAPPRSRTGKARFMDERMERFFRDALAAARGGGVGPALVPRVRRGAGRHVPLRSSTDGTVGLYNSGFDPARAALAPGIVLLAAADPGRHRARGAGVRLPARRGALQVRVRPDAARSPAPAGGPYAGEPA